MRKVYAFELDTERIGRLGGELRPAFESAGTELVDFAAFLEGLAQKG